MAAYGDTPQTPSDSDDDDDDINMNNNQNNYGGFHENVLDNANNNNNTNISDNTNNTNNDNNDNNDDNNNNNNDNWVKIDYEGYSQTVFLSSDIRTFGDIKNHLIQQDRINGTSHFDISSSHAIVDIDEDHEYQDDDDAYIASGKTLVIRWNAFFIGIVDGSDFNVRIRVAEDFTILRIKEQVKKDRNIRLETLSKDGLELQNDKTLKDYDIYDNGHTLISRIQIQIIDNLCSLSTDILVCEFWSIEDVLNIYLQTTRREKHINSKLLLNSQDLDYKSTVYDEKIENTCVLEYYVGKYNVLLYDSDNNNNANNNNNNNNNNSNDNNNNSDMLSIEIEVMDNQTIKEIQDSYARLTRKPFMKNDKLLSNERELEENVQLFRLRIKDNEPLIIEREQQQKPSQYICAECGSIVSLRPYDAVQCRECFHQIVYKQRTKRVCQYNCR